MKCKKLFAMLLSLCMIASAFVAVSAEEKVKQGEEWVTPSSSAPMEGKIEMSPSYAKFVSVNDGVYSFTTKGVVDNVGSGSWSTLFCIGLELNTAIEEGSEFTFSFDLLTDGVRNSAGDLYEEMTVYARLIDNGGDYATQGNTIGFITGTLEVNTGSAVHVEFKSSDMAKSFSGINANSTSTAIKKMCIVINVADACTGYKSEANDGAFTISNIVATSPTIVSTTTMADKNVTMTIANNSGLEYKLEGTLFIAEYDGNKLVQFASQSTSGEYAADQDVTVTASFENAPAAGNTVKAFLWDTATLAPHYFAPNVQ